MARYNLLIDSTGIKVEGEGERNARKHGGTKRRVWRKIHIGIDEKTLEIRATEFTTSNVGDAPMLPELLDQIPQIRRSGSVTADGAFDTRKCHEPLPSAVQPQSFRRARTPSRGSLTLPARSRATRPCEHQNASAGRSGDDGAAITAEAASKPRCIV